VTDMVRLKYGHNTLLSNKLIVEAEKSLSQWMAAQKSNIVSGHSQVANHSPTQPPGILLSQMDRPCHT
jgi:hypothetical protein